MEFLKLATIVLFIVPLVALNVLVLTHTEETAISVEKYLNMAGTPRSWHRRNMLMRVLFFPGVSLLKLRVYMMGYSSKDWKD